MSIRSISAVFEISRNTVRRYVRQFQESGLTMETLQSIPEHHLQEMFCSGVEHSKQPSARQKELEALLPEYAARAKRKGGLELAPGQLSLFEEAQPLLDGGPDARDLLPPEARMVLDGADVILSKGQGNYESLSGQGRHIFYSFLCKCDLFQRRFGALPLTGMFIEENPDAAEDDYL
jgi:hypothetical protein